MPLYTTKLHLLLFTLIRLLTSNVDNVYYNKIIVEVLDIQKH